MKIKLLFKPKVFLALLLTVGMVNASFDPIIDMETEDFISVCFPRHERAETVGVHSTLLGKNVAYVFPIYNDDGRRALTVRVNDFQDADGGHAHFRDTYHEDFLPDGNSFRLIRDVYHNTYEILFEALEQMNLNDTEIFFCGVGKGGCLATLLAAGFKNKHSESMLEHQIKLITFLSPKFCDQRFREGFSALISVDDVLRIYTKNVHELGNDREYCGIGVPLQILNSEMIRDYLVELRFLKDYIGGIEVLQASLGTSYLKSGLETMNPFSVVAGGIMLCTLPLTNKVRSIARSSILPSQRTLENAFDYLQSRRHAYGVQNDFKIWGLASEFGTRNPLLGS